MLVMVVLLLLADGLTVWRGLGGPRRELERGVRDVTLNTGAFSRARVPAGRRGHICIILRLYKSKTEASESSQSVLIDTRGARYPCEVR